MGEPDNSFLQKVKDDPHAYLGFAGCLATAGYGLYNFKNREISASLFLTRLRVIAQSVFVVTLTAGVGYQLVTKHIIPRLTKSGEHSSSSVEK